MGWGVLNAAMLLGVLGAAVPVVIHLLNRRRDEVIDWGAMQFLESGPRSRCKLRWTELLLMLVRMTLLALVGLALARPYWSASADLGSRGGGLGLMVGTPARDVVLVLDGSDSMERRCGGTTPRALAVRWARRFVRELRPGDSAAVLVAGDRVRPLVDPPRSDLSGVDAKLARLGASRGSSDVPAALAEAFRVLERARNSRRDVIVLTDGQRFAWRPDEPGRWALVRDLHRRSPIPSRIWSVAFGADIPSDAPNGSVGPLKVTRALVTPGLPLMASTVVTNAGPGALTRTAELLVDGRPMPGSAQVVGPVPAGGRAPLSFRTTIPTRGAHLLTVRLVGGDDALPGDDASSLPVEVTEALPVLLVDGEPALEPLSGETDFLRAALNPTGDETPQVRVTVVTPETFRPESLKGQRVVVLANVDRPSDEQAAALGRFLESGGGLLIIPGDRSDADAYNTLGWMPARLGAFKGDPGARTTAAHPEPRTFAGPVLASLAQGDSPTLAEADIFAYRVLTPVPGASVIARLDTGDPWAVARAPGRGRALVLSTPLDAEAGTLPANPDFVPLVHELIFGLAGGVEARVLPPGEPLVFDLKPPPAESVSTLNVQTPSGAKVRVPVLRMPGAARVRFEDTTESGVYRLLLPDGTVHAYASIAGDVRESDLSPLAPAEAATLAEGWPLQFESDPARLAERLRADERGGRHEIWRGLILAALAGLCLEVYLTRRIVRSQGLA